MASFGTLLRIELIKAIRRPMTWILGIIFIGFMGFMYGVLSLAALVTTVEDAEGMELAGLEEQMMLPDGLAFGSSLVVGVGAVVMIIFAAGIYGSEFGWATIRTVLLMRAPRIPLVIAKLAMILVMTAVVALVGIVISIAGSLAFEALAAESPDIGSRLNTEMFSDALVIYLRSTAAIFAWALMGGMLALALNSMAIGTGIALAIYFIGDLIVTLIAQVGALGEWFARFMPTWGINALIQMNQVTPPEYSTWETVGIFVNLIGYAIIFLALGILRFREADVLAKSS